MMIYPEIEPSAVDYIVDFVCLSEYSPSDEWENDVEANIDSLRKRNISINFAGVDAKELTLEITQTSHNYPFGHAVVSQNIADCETSGVDNAYCNHVKDNYNWIVDTYRCAVCDIIKFIIFVYKPYHDIIQLLKRLKNS